MRDQDYRELSLPGGDHLVAPGTPHFDRVGARCWSPGLSPGQLLQPLSEDPLLVEGLESLVWTTLSLSLSLSLNSGDGHGSHIASQVLGLLYLKLRLTSETMISSSYTHYKLYS